jgi:protein-S-isoprenylcysteine O-methyltransferase Ste14
MNRLQNLPIPRRLHYRVWLLTLPSALISFERRQKVPKLPIGRWRLTGIPILAAGIGIIVWATRESGRISYSGPGSRLTKQPATTGGIVVLAGVALLLRSAVLAGYSAALLLASGTEAITLEEPDLEGFVPTNR